MESIQNPKQFTTTYLLLLTRLWESDTEVARLRADPRGYAIEAGLPVNVGAQVRVDESTMDECDTDAQLVKDWTTDPEVHVLHAPPAPTFDAAELSGMELDAMSAGTPGYLACSCSQDPTLCYPAGNR